jgi:hypothetical protein
VSASARATETTTHPADDGQEDGESGVSTEIVRDADPEAINVKLVKAGERLGFPVRVPDYFPTSANKLAQITTNLGPSGHGIPKGNGVPMLNLGFDGGPFTFDGKPGISSLVIFELNGRLNSPTGKLWEQDLAGFTVYQDISGTDGSGKPTRTSYMALEANATFVFIFEGEQPTREGLERMLASLHPFSP